MDRKWYSRLPKRFTNLREGDLSATDQRKRPIVKASCSSRMGHGAQFLRTLRLSGRSAVPLDRQRSKASMEPVHSRGDQKRGHRAIFLQAARSTRFVGAKVIRAVT